MPNQYSSTTLPLAFSHIQTKLGCLLAFLLLQSTIVRGQTGSIRGSVLDAQSGSPIAGAILTLKQVVGESITDTGKTNIMATRGGTLSDYKGMYRLGDLSPGVYAIQVRAGEFRPLDIADLEVRNDAATERDILLTRTDYQGPPPDVRDTVRVQAIERKPEAVPSPVVPVKSLSSASGMSRKTSIDSLSHYPIRGIDEILVMQSGIVERKGSFYPRGSRSESMYYTLDGAPINDPINSGRAFPLTPEALDVVDVSTGGYGAEFSGTHGGLVQSRIRSGGDTWKYTFVSESDAFAPAGVKRLGSFSNGISDFVLTAGGPVTKNVRTFVSAEYFYDGPGSNTWSDAFDFGKVITLSQPTPQHPSVVRADTFNLSAWGGGARYGWNRTTSVTGSMDWGLSPTKIRFSGMVSFNDYKNGLQWWQQYLDPKLTGVGYNNNGIGILKITHDVNPTTRVEASLNIQHSDAKTYDPDFGDNLWAYGDSARNAARGVAMRGNNYWYSNYYIDFGNGLYPGAGIPSIPPPGAGVRAAYSKSSRSGFGLRADVTTSLSPAVNVMAGFDLQNYTSRSYTPGSLFSWAQYKKYLNGNPQDPNDSLGRIMKYYIRSSQGNIYGYDLFGNEIENDLTFDTPQGRLVETSGPVRTSLGGGYVDSRIELRNCLFHAGFRYDYISSGVYELVSPGKLAINDSLGMLTPDNFSKARALHFFLPRLEIVVALTEATQTYARFGEYVQFLKLDNNILSQWVFMYGIRSGTFPGQGNALGSTPERSTQFSLGMKHRFDEYLTLDLETFYKSISNQLRYSTMYSDIGSYPYYAGNDVTEARGLTLRLNVLGPQRLTASLFYTLSDVQTTGSDKNSDVGLIGTGQPVPDELFPATFNQRHRGIVDVDYRFGKDEGGPVLEQLGLNVLFRFNSGFNYTRVFSATNNYSDPRMVDPIEETGASTTPWYFRLDARIDKSFDVGSVKTTFYIYVQNLLNRQNGLSVKPRTNDVYNDGWLASLDGKALLSQLGAAAAQYSQMYTYVNSSVGSADLDIPRTIRFGIRLEY